VTPQGPNRVRPAPFKKRRAPDFRDEDAVKFLKRGYDALRAHDLKEAGACCALVLKYKPKAKEAHFLVGLIAAESEDWPTAKKAFKTVTTFDADHTAAWAQLARIYMVMGQYSNAEHALEHASRLEPADPLVQDVIGSVYSLLGNQQKALSWFDKACGGSKSAVFELSRAKSLTFLGNMTEAKKSLLAVIAERPSAAQAHWMLSRVETAVNSDHVNQIQKLVAAEPAGSRNLPFLHYACGKEKEDMLDWSGAFESYNAGAAARRREVEFDEQAEIAMFNAFEKNFDQEWYEKVPGGGDDPSPIFIVGQPRTGTTLVERLITAHSDVRSAGELQQFGMAIKRSLGATSSKPMTAEIVERAATELDPSSLAQMYQDTTRAVQPDSPRFIDKLPVNYLYVPLIAAAFPKAKIIHLVRGAMDSCFASYKQLFAQAYYHSYDQCEMARHHIRYRKLMDHYRLIVGPRMLDVHYETLVTDFEPNARKIIDFLGLGWQEAVLDFHEQDGAVTTASAAQVREKAHSRSVGRWRQFENFLGPMKNTLGKAGF